MDKVAAASGHHDDADCPLLDAAVGGAERTRLARVMRHWASDNHALALLQNVNLLRQHTYLRAASRPAAERPPEAVAVQLARASPSSVLADQPAAPYFAPLMEAWDPSLAGRLAVAAEHHRAGAASEAALHLAAPAGSRGECVVHLPAPRGAARGRSPLIRVVGGCAAPSPYDRVRGAAALTVDVKMPVVPVTPAASGTGKSLTLRHVRTFRKELSAEARWTAHVLKPMEAGVPTQRPVVQYHVVSTTTTTVREDSAAHAPVSNTTTTRHGVLSFLVPGGPDGALRALGELQLEMTLTPTAAYPPELAYSSRENGSGRYYWWMPTYVIYAPPWLAAWGALAPLGPCEWLEQMVLRSIASPRVFANVGASVSLPPPQEGDATSPEGPSPAADSAPLAVATSASERSHCSLTVNIKRGKAQPAAPTTGQASAGTLARRSSAAAAEAPSVGTELMPHQIVDALRSLDYDRRCTKAAGTIPNVHSDAVEALSAAVALAEVHKYQCPPEVAKALLPLLPSVNSGAAHNNNGSVIQSGIVQPHSPVTAISPERTRFAHRTASSVSGGSSTYERPSSTGSAAPPNPTAALIGPDGLSTAAGGTGVAPVTVEMAGATGNFTLTAPRHGGVRIHRTRAMDYISASKSTAALGLPGSSTDTDAAGGAATAKGVDTSQPTTDPAGAPSAATLPPPPLPPRPPPLPPPLTPGFVPVAFVHLNTFDGANFNPTAAHQFRSGLAAAMSSADLGRAPGAASWGRSGPAAARAPSYLLRMRSGADALWCSLLAAELTGMF